MKYMSFAIFAALFLFASSVYAEENVCVGCHADAAKDWTQSIHAKNGITCANCHGGNPKDAEMAMDPKFGFVGKPAEGDIPAFCGKCHAGVKENYLKSPHDAALGKGGPSCITCHTAHRQQRANIDLIVPKLCGSCHGFERAQKIKNAMLLSETEITNLEKRIEALRIQGYDVDPQQKALFAVRNTFHRLTHIVDVELILKETTGIQDEIERLKNEISSDEKVEIKRKLYGSALILFFVIGALIFWLYRNTSLSDDE